MLMMDMDQNDDDEEDDDDDDDDDDEDEDEDEEDAWCMHFVHASPVKVRRADHKRSWKNFGVWLTLYHHYTPLKTNMSP